MLSSFKDIPFRENWKVISEIKKGWSNDKKYYIETKDNEKLLLRTSDIKLYESKRKEFEFIKIVNALDFQMSKALYFGKDIKDSYVYMILNWIDGKTLYETLPHLSEKKQYLLGIEAGQILKKIHSIPVEEKDIPPNKEKYHLWKLENFDDNEINGMKNRYYETYKHFDGFEKIIPSWYITKKEVSF